MPTALYIDDKRARKIAQLNGIKTIGSLGVLLEAKMKRVVPELRPLLQVLYNSDVFITKELCDYVLELVSEESL